MAEKQDQISYSEMINQINKNRAAALEYQKQRANEAEARRAEAAERRAANLESCPFGLW